MSMHRIASVAGAASALTVALLLVSACDQKSAGDDKANDEDPAGQAEQSAMEESGTGEEAEAEEGPAAQQEEAAPSAPRVTLYPKLQSSVDDLVEGFDQIPADRKKQLKKLALFVKTKRSSGEPAELTFICTHNSRRSHLSQLWAATAAAYYGVGGVKTYSGGTESTAFNPRAVAAVERAGFQVQKPEGEQDNPHYKVKFADAAPEQECFSKKYDDPTNPQEGFAAIMTCSQADKNCPNVQGAALRVALPFVDPKESDGTPEEAATYDERSRHIGTEMFYLFSQVSDKG